MPNGWLGGITVPSSCSSGTSSAFYLYTTPSIWDCIGNTYVIRGGGGSMIYPSVGIARSTGSAWTTSLAVPTGSLVGTGQTNSFTVGQNFQTYINVGQNSIASGQVNFNGGSSIGSAISLGINSAGSLLTAGGNFAISGALSATSLGTPFGSLALANYPATGIAVSTGSAWGNSGGSTVDSSGNITTPGKMTTGFGGSAPGSWQPQGAYYGSGANAIPSCGSSIIATRTIVSDATVATLGSTYATGGTYTIGVQCIYNSSGATYTWIID